MRLVTMRLPDGETRAGVVDGDEVTELPYVDVGALLADEPDPRRVRPEADARHYPLDAVALAPPVPRPAKIVCVGMNYASHARELGMAVPSYPMLFAKFARTLTGPRDRIVLPAVSNEMDWEVELGVVIGRPVRHANPSEAASAIAGYTVVNDVSARDWQRRTSEFLQGKAFESTTPVGPALVTPDELPGGSAGNLKLRCEVDGELRQEGSTSDMIFPPADLVAYVSQIVTLEPGDLLVTGTPPGVGAARRPPVWLQPGQTVRSVVDGLGELVNQCVREEVSGGTA